MKKSMRGLPIVMLILALSLMLPVRGLAADENTHVGAGEQGVVAEQPGTAPETLDGGLSDLEANPMGPATEGAAPSPDEPTDVEVDTSRSAAEPATEEAQTVTRATPAESELTAMSSTSAYIGGSIPILRLTFHDDVNDAGEVTLSGAEKIDLVNGSPNHSYQAQGVTMTIEVPADYDNPESDLWDGVSGYTGVTDIKLEYFRGRGNSSWNANKKPYKLKLDKKANLFGMGSNKHWVLMANAYDNSLIVDRLVAWIGDQLGMAYTPRGVPVDLFVNGEYYGNYLLMEQVRIDSNRVDIDEVFSSAADPDSLGITGGYLIGTSSKPDASPDEYFDTAFGTTFSYDTPEFEQPLSDADRAQQAYLKSFLDRVEEAINGDDLTNGQGEKLWSLMDAQSTADMWWVQEFTTNNDAFITPSTYLYKVRDTEGADGTRMTGKLYWGPLWDFDYIWASHEVEGLDNTDAAWVSLLRRDPEFVELLKGRWHVLDGVLEEVTREGGLLDAYAEELEESWAADQEAFPTESFGADDPEQDVVRADSCSEAIEILRSFFVDRRAWINAHLDELPKAFIKMRFFEGDVEVTSFLVEKDGFDSHQTPKATEREGLYFTGWVTKDGVAYDPYETYPQDMDFYAQYVDQSSVEAVTMVYYPVDEVWIGEETDITHSVHPTGAQDRRVTWSTSDESVVAVDAHGQVTPQPGCTGESGTAEAWVIAHLVNTGQDFPVRVIVYDPEKVTLPETTAFSVEKSMTLGMGEFKPIELTIEPSPSSLNEHFNVMFESSNNGVAMADHTGMVMGISAGTAEVTVRWMNPETGEVLAEEVVRVTVLGETEPDPETFTVTYDLNGGMVDGSTAKIMERHFAGELIKLPEAPTRKGYTFLYWKGSRYLPGDTYTVTEDHTFVAQWKLATQQEMRKSETQATTAAQREALAKTGDENNPLAWKLLLAGALCAFGLAYLVRRSRDGES